MDNMLSDKVVLELVDVLFHKYASIYREDAKEDAIYFMENLDPDKLIKKLDEQIMQLIRCLMSGRVKKEDLDEMLVSKLLSYINKKDEKWKSFGKDLHK